MLLYDPDVPKAEALWLDLAEEPGLSVDKALRPGDLDQAVFDYLEPRSRGSHYAGNNDSTNRTQ